MADPNRKLFTYQLLTPANESSRLVDHQLLVPTDTKTTYLCISSDQFSHWIGSVTFKYSDLCRLVGNTAWIVWFIRAQRGVKRQEIELAVGIRISH